ncbi:TRAP transporter small permease subunit [Sulfitobacter sp. F26204]|uniref:TRAP transporter small permease n=1 Tax=Sulfitobacter sp. F26204 TaxID=2996014 RepID=UPI00225DF80A|nr:TRAP transporter small permease subunit [Sulfitobacter sp. F26204]MCX7560623.1 TRAP transporter small permease subunit [Sulfitobacter sp. F26204]
MQLDYTNANSVFPRANSILRIFENLAFWFSATSVAILGALAVFSISLRMLTGRAIPDDNIMIGDLVVAIVALSWATVTATQGNIVVEVFTNWVGERGQAMLRLLASLVGMMMIFPLCWASWTMAKHSIIIMTYYDGLLHWPQWPSRTTFFVAFLLMSIRLVFLAATDAVLAIRGPKHEQAN